MQQQPDASLAELRTVFESSVVGIVRFDAEGRVTAWNPGAERIFGWSADEVLGRPTPHVPEDKREEFRALLDRVLDGERLSEVDVRRWRKDGSPIDLIFSAVPVGHGGERAPEVIGTIVDVTERKRAEAALRQSEEQYRLLFENSPRPMWIFELGTLRFLAVNDAATQHYGYSRDEFLSMTIADIRPPEGIPRLLENVGRVSEGLDRLGVWTHRKKDGTLIDVEITSHTTTFDGKPAKLVLADDVTQRERMQQELREAEEQYRFLVERIPAIVYFAEFGEPGPWLYVSPHATTLSGYTPEEWIADEALWMKLIHPDDLERVLQTERESKATGRPFSSEYRMRTRDGRIVWVRDDAEVVRDEVGRPALLRGLILDITDLKVAQEELAGSFELLRRTDEERRRLLSKLVAAQEEERTKIANDIHDDSIQVMTAVGIRLEAFRRRCSNPADVQALGRLEATVGESIGRLRHLLFELRPRALDEAGLAPALGMHLDEMERETGIRCRLKDQLLDEPMPETRVILYRVAQEALANARKHSQARHVEVALAASDGGFAVRILDDGQGFELEGVETGLPGHLGLHAMRERVEMSGGRFEIQTAPGAGTAVEFWLPERAAAASAPDRTTGGGTALPGA